MKRASSSQVFQLIGKAATATILILSLAITGCNDKTTTTSSKSAVAPKSEKGAEKTNLNSEQTSELVKKQEAPSQNEVKFPEKPKFSKSAKVDLNSDGMTDDISITEANEEGDYTLKINNATISGHLDADGTPVEELLVVDIDKADKYKEVGVHTTGASDDDQYAMYWYDGSSIKEMGTLERWPRFSGNGIVLVESWMGFWMQTNKYVLAADRILQLVPQELYNVGIQGTVSNSFPIYETRGSNKVVANLKKGSKIQIILCDTSQGAPNFWYLIKSETNLLGWVKDENIGENITGIPIAD